MGGCIGITRNRSGPTEANTSTGTISRPNSGAARKNQSLCHETIRWKSDVPLTEGQLRSKRDEFWETAPAFEGRKEIWDALRAAAIAAESMDFELAQAILDGANVSVPNGYLTECYDEWGTRYQIPIYCLSQPINMVKENCGRDTPTTDRSDSAGTQSVGDEVTLKLRLSDTSRDVKLLVYGGDSVSQCKKKLQIQEDVDASKQRWYYGGKLLGDKLKIEEVKITPGYLVQVIINCES